MIIPVWAAVMLTLGAALVGAVHLDRVRSPGAPGPRDENRPDFYAPLENQTWQVPTSYIDHRTGAGPPPGVEPDGEERETLSNTDRRRDPRSPD